MGQWPSRDRNFKEAPRRRVFFAANQVQAGRSFVCEMQRVLNAAAAG